MGLAQESAGSDRGEMVKRTYTSAIDGAALDYALWLPAGYAAGSDWPLIVFLHGSAEGTNWMAPTRPAASVPVLGEMADLPFVVAFPLMRGSWSISTLAERDVMDVVVDVESHCKIDPDQVHLVGLSLGGFAGWRIASRYPDRFATLTAFCGGGEPELAVNLRHLGLNVVHGTRDRNVPVSLSREMVAALKQAGIEANYTEYPQSGHVVWGETLGSGLLYRWMSNRRRVGDPRRISFRTYTLRHASAYWATVESMIDPAKPAFVDVFVPPGDTLVLVQADNVGRLSLKVPGLLIEAERRVRFEVNGEIFQARRDDRGWRLDIEPAKDGTWAKRPGLSGPIQDVFYEKFVVVVPSEGGPQVVNRWLAAAGRAMAWTQQMVANRVQVVSASAVTDELMGEAHLICFGNPSNNAVLRRMTGLLPLHADTGRVFAGGEALDGHVVGFVMIHPNPLAPDRYLVVCSGLAEAVAELGAAVLGPIALSPPRVEDLVLMGADGKIVNWKGANEKERGLGERMGARLPGRGPVLDRNWRLEPAALEWLHSIKPPPERKGPTPGAPR